MDRVIVQEIDNTTTMTLAIAAEIILINKRLLAFSGLAISSRKGEVSFQQFGFKEFPALVAMFIHLFQTFIRDHSLQSGQVQTNLVIVEDWRIQINRLMIVPPIPMITIKIPNPTA